MYRRRLAGEFQDVVMSAVFRIDASRHPLSDGCPPDWASGWGQDSFGVFVDFTAYGVTQRMRWCPPGNFTMGASADEAIRWGGETPRHQVTLTKGFWLFDTPCTQELWQAVMDGNPSHFTASPKLPVEMVSWGDVQTFLSRLNGHVPDLNLSLPSEAQWEYACRANSFSAPDLDAVAWHDTNSGKETHPVASKMANAWGLYDMLGNVLEWCADGKRIYGSNAVVDPVGPADKARAARGGSWISPVGNVHAAYRNAEFGRLLILGFRCARVEERRDL